MEQREGRTKARKGEKNKRVKEKEIGVTEEKKRRKGYGKEKLGTVENCKEWMLERRDEKEYKGKGRMRGE